MTQEGSFKTKKKCNDKRSKNVAVQICGAEKYVSEIFLAIFFKTKSI